MEKLDIIIVKTNASAMNRITFVDFHKMLEINETDESPVCDFGIYVSKVEEPSDAASKVDINVGDIVLAIDEEDLLSMTAAQFKNHLSKIQKSFIKSIYMM